MNTHTFGNHYITCPICQRSGSLKLVKMCNGLYTCKSCQERLVVTWSGHYVRDPFSGKQVVIAQLLRRQSHPWARFLRDISLLKRPIMFIALSAVIFGASVLTIESTRQPNSVQQVVEQGNEPPKPQVE
ncbi:hypothetical protein [Aliterella atlantica]|uniref:Uncharacterized protein n=1 Tax=Aliterella atlantica CENA595 TaxID=1618023 RepID=A0A0D8ZSQ8_9CYAN|nr:hypothetical protein [Aliterella atlantica]KJH71397.1 hypothetical protein UH38_12620 [Aliterella atlantica CENA595]